MGLFANKAADAVNNSSSKSDGSQNGNSKVPGEKFMLGTSQCYFEPAAYLTGKLSVEKVKSLLTHEKAVVSETQGKSLKVNFRTPTEEFKFMGFITMGDASLELDEEDIPQIMNHVHNESIVKAISVDDLVALF